MRAIGNVVGGLGMVGFVGLALFSMGMTVYGLYLAFSASVILGLFVFMIEPSPFLIGLAMFFFHKNLAQMLIDFLTK